MEFKGTKGEWVNDGKNVIVKKSSGLGKLICECISKQFNSYHNTEEETRANAKLISCAPEMLEMLKNSIKEINHLKETYKDIGHCGKYLHQCNELIQKATT